MYEKLGKKYKFPPGQVSILVAALKCIPKAKTNSFRKHNKIHQTTEVTHTARATIELQVTCCKFREITTRITRTIRKLATELHDQNNEAEKITTSMINKQQLQNSE